MPLDHVHSRSDGAPANVIASDDELLIRAFRQILHGLKLTARFEMRKRPLHVSHMGLFDESLSVLVLLSIELQRIQNEVYNMSVESQHPEYRKYLKVWQRIEAAVEGTRAVKSGKTMFLPKPNQDLDGESFYGTPIQSENDVRYKQYLERAVYTNFCGRTLAGLKGAAFRKYPSIYLAPGVEYLEDSATADGTSLVQLAKDAVAEVLKKGRAALLVDYPSVEEGLTAEQVTRLDLKARIAFYTPEAVINWRMQGQNGRSVMTLCVLKEMYNKSQDEFDYDVESIEDEYFVYDGKGGKVFISTNFEDDHLLHELDNVHEEIEYERDGEWIPQLRIRAAHASMFIYKTKNNMYITESASHKTKTTDYNKTTKAQNV